MRADCIPFHSLFPRTVFGLVYTLIKYWLNKLMSEHSLHVEMNHKASQLEICFEVQHSCHVENR